MTELFWILVGLNVFDAYTTIRILKAGGHELNPLLAWLFKRVGYTWALVGLKALVLVGLYFLWPLVPVWVQVGVVGVYLVVVLRNFDQL